VNMTHSTNKLELQLVMTACVITAISSLDLPVVNVIYVLPYWPGLIILRKILNVTLEIFGGFFVRILKVNRTLF